MIYSAGNKANAKKFRISKMAKVFIPANCGKKEFQNLTGCEVWYRDKKKHCVSFKLWNDGRFPNYDELQKFIEDNFSNVKVWRSINPNPNYGKDVFRVRVYPEVV